MAQVRTNDNKAQAGTPMSASVHILPNTRLVSFQGIYTVACGLVCALVSAGGSLSVASQLPIQDD